MEHVVDQYGLAFLFLIVFLESAGVWVPGEAALVAAGVLASRGHFWIAEVIVLAALGAILGGEPGSERMAGSADALALEMAAEVIRAGLTGLAIWWSEHPEVPREQVVATAVNVLWIGFERVRRGETWTT